MFSIIQFSKVFLILCSCWVTSRDTAQNGGRAAAEYRSDLWGRPWWKTCYSGSNPQHFSPQSLTQLICQGCFLCICHMWFPWSSPTVGALHRNLRAVAVYSWFLPLKNYCKVHCLLVCRLSLCFIFFCFYQYIKFRLCNCNCNCNFL